MKKLAILALLAVLAQAGCGGSAGSETRGSAVVNADGPGPPVHVPAGPPPKELVIKNLRRGRGKPAREGSSVVVNYVGARWDGKAYSNSWSYRTAPVFVVGGKRLIPGFDRGIRGMRAGGRRLLLIPTKLAYRPSAPGPGGLSSNLVFVVDMLKVR